MRSISNGLLYFLTLGVAGYAVVAYGFLPLGSLVHPDMKANFLAHSSGIYTHAFASIVALTLGPFQFSTRLRQKNTNVYTVGSVAPIWQWEFLSVVYRAFTCPSMHSAVPWPSLALPRLRCSGSTLAYAPTLLSAVVLSLNIGSGWYEIFLLRLPP